MIVLNSFRRRSALLDAIDETPYDARLRYPPARDAIITRGPRDHTGQNGRATMAEEDVGSLLERMTATYALHVAASRRVTPGTTIDIVDNPG
jgi:hypothetical protein